MGEGFLEACAPVTSERVNHSNSSGKQNGRALEQSVEGVGTCGGRSAAAGPRALENGPSGLRLRLWEKGARPGRPPLEVAEARAGRQLRPPPRRGARASKTGKASQTG